MSEPIQYPRYLHHPERDSIIFDDAVSGTEALKNGWALTPFPRLAPEQEAGTAMSVGEARKQLIEQKLKFDFEMGRAKEGMLKDAQRIADLEKQVAELKAQAAPAPAAPESPEIAPAEPKRGTAKK